MTVLVQNIKTDSIARDSTRVVGSNHVMEIATSLQQKVVHDQAVTIGGNETLQVGENRSKNVDGNEVSLIAGKRSVSTAEAHTTKVLHTRKLAVGAAMITSRSATSARTRSAA